MNYAGLVALNGTIDVAIVSKNSSQIPTDADSLPTYRVYAAGGFLTSGSLSFKDAGVITNCPPANPTVYTSPGHNLTTGTLVTVTGVGGNVGANTTAAITAVSANTFTTATDTHAGSAYTSGGSFHSTGVYDLSITPTLGANYQSGSIYSVYIYGAYSSVATLVESLVFQVT